MNRTGQTHRTQQPFPGENFRFMARILTLAAFIGIMHAVAYLRGPQDTTGSSTLLLGFLLLASYLAGRAARVFSLPQITGYLIIGILAGPYVLGTVPAPALEDFGIVNEVALALIALSAGGELRLKSLRGRMRSIGVITAFQIVLVFLVVALAVFLARGSVPFLQDQPARVAVAVALLFGLVAVAKSPATTVAVITEEKARGILTDTVLGITVLKDVIILVLIAVLIPLAQTIANPMGAFSLHEARDILLAIAGSLAMGIVLGWFMTLYLRRIRAYRILFVLGVAFMAVLMDDLLDLHHILIAMAAGFYVQNYSRQGRLLLHALEAIALPVYALFFAIAGAGLDITVLKTAWVIATAIILTRMVALWTSTRLGAHFVGDPPVIRKYAWMGFLAKAGVTLGIANLVRDEFPGWGAEVATVVIAMIAVNQLIGPPAFRWALVRAGESRVQAAGTRVRR
jgi:Kef-type K+ transport system membrane component KefB